METELKLLLDPAHVAAFRKHPLLARHAQALPRTKDQVGVYFDTPAMDLRRNDAGLRVRRTGNEFVQTLKAGGGVQGGLHQRNEWESVVPGEQPDMAELRALVQDPGDWARAIFAPEVASQVRPIFATRIQRTLWDLVLADGTEVECVLDLGVVEHGQLQDPVCEIELELKSGNPLALFDFALALTQDVGLRIGVRSKAQRGYTLFHQAARAATATSTATTSSASKATPLQLSRKMTVEQAFVAIVGNCMEQVLANDIADGDTQDIERLHQMRVGLRRLRSAFSLFRDLVALPAPLVAEFDWLGDAIGQARDWDVLANSTLDKLPVNPQAALNLTRVRDAALSQAAAHHRSAVRAVASPRYTALVLQLTRWMLGMQWRPTVSLAQQQALLQPVAHFARLMLRHDDKRLTKRARLIDQDSHARHRARIAAKKLRYDTEFFRSLFAEKRARPFLKALSRLQEQLGLANDIAVADALLEQLQRKDGSLAANVAYARGFLAAQANEGEERVHRLWKKWKALELPA